MRFEMFNAFYDGGAAEAGLSLVAVATWPALWRFAGPDGRVTVSRARLQDATGLSESSVKRALAELKGKRMLKVIKHGNIGTGAPTYAIAPFPMPAPAGKGVSQ
jgi:hypothetical protein